MGNSVSCCLSRVSSEALAQAQSSYLWSAPIRTRLIEQVGLAGLAIGNSVNSCLSKISSDALGMKLTEQVGLAGLTRQPGLVGLAGLTGLAALACLVGSAVRRREEKLGTLQDVHLDAPLDQWARSDEQQVHERPMEQPNSQHRQSLAHTPVTLMKNDILSVDESASARVMDSLYNTAMTVESIIEDTPGLYEIIEDRTVVTKFVSTESEEVAELEHGIVVNVVEVVAVPDEKRIRGRVVPRTDTNTAVLAGWISLHDTDDGFRWVNKVEASRAAEPGVYLIIEDGTSVTECMSSKSAKVSELKHGTVLEVVEIVSVQGEDCIRGRVIANGDAQTGHASPAGWISLHNTIDTFQWATRVDVSHADGPGTYVIVEDGTVVTEGSSIESTEVAELAHGTQVEVVEVHILDDEERIRARIISPEGWISVLDTDDGFRWAWMVPSLAAYRARFV